ncbi:ubiquinone/menaquinone biosynthesis methyltransferase [Methanosarcina siciliae HI350]|uniref:Ubiquinone/menaquinone biosynthesis methyltransferase n=1 Tax=Methanosarcina siciliae HI350 TaxID=1434119 RepID=A0A0E3PBV5_9EURY|nr:class I SAM-dependent methyltransferase [Methanosarcina siciliae]AKB31642.1 ubiquinone/menaquinone biosynthesis methyltransferase [Methanosarcina siciliae HI350]
MKDKITAHWNKRSPSYRKMYRDHLDEEILLMKNLFSEKLPAGKKLSVLDIGTGPGIQAFVFAELGHNVTALDISKEMLAGAKEGARNRNLLIRFVEGDGENLPFEACTFDIIVNMHLLWTLTDHDKFFSECKRVLVPGGRILAIDGQWFQQEYVSDGNNNPEERTHEELIEYLPLYKSNSPEMIAGLMENNGFSGVSWKALPEYAEYMKRCDPEGHDYLSVPYLATGVKY